MNIMIKTLFKTICLFICLLTSASIALANGGGGDINSGSKSGQASQMLGMGMNAAMGALMASECSSTNKMACIMAAQAFMQAAMMGGAAGKSGAVAEATEFTMPDLNLPEFPNTEIPLNPTEVLEPTAIDSGPAKDIKDLKGKFRDPKIKGQIQSLADKGINIDEENGIVTSPEGTFNSASTSSPSAAAAAGFSPEEISQNFDTVNKLSKAAANINLDDLQFDSMGGGAGGGGSGYDYKPRKFSSSFKGFGNLGKKRKPASVAGLKKNFAGEPIGVAVDDIFDMVHRRYQDKRKAQAFIETP